MKQDQKNEASNALMETHYGAKTEKSAIQRAYGDTLSRKIRKIRHPSRLWRHIIAQDQKMRHPSRL